MKGQTIERRPSPAPADLDFIDRRAMVRNGMNEHETRTDADPTEACSAQAAEQGEEPLLFRGLRIKLDVDGRVRPIVIVRLNPPLPR